MVAKAGIDDFRNDRLGRSGTVGEIERAKRGPERSEGRGPIGPSNQRHGDFQPSLTESGSREISHLRRLPVPYRS